MSSGEVEAEMVCALVSIFLLTQNITGKSPARVWMGRVNGTWLGSGYGP